MGGISSSSSGNFREKINFAKSKISSDTEKVMQSTIDNESLITLDRQSKKLEKLESKTSNSGKSLAKKTLDRLEAYSKEIQTVLDVGDNNLEKYIDVLMGLESNTTREMVRKAIEEAKSNTDKTEEIFNQLKVDLNIRQFQLNCKKQNTTDFEETKESLTTLSEQASSIKTALQSMKPNQWTLMLKKQIDPLNLNSITLPNSFNDSKVKQKVEKLKSEITEDMKKASHAKYFNSFRTLQNIIDKVKELSAILDGITSVYTKPHLDLHLTKEQVSEQLTLKKKDLDEKKTELKTTIVSSLGTNTSTRDDLQKQKVNLEAEISSLEDLQKYHGSANQIYEQQIQKWETGKHHNIMSSLVSDLKSQLTSLQNEVVEEFEWQKTSSEATFNKEIHFSNLTTFKQSKSIDELIQKTTTRASKANLNADTKARLDARSQELESIKEEMTGSTLLGYVGWAGDTPTKEEQNAKLSQIQVLVFRKQDDNLEYKFLKAVAAKDDLFERNGTEKADFKTDYKKSQLLTHLRSDAIQGGDGVGGGGNDDLYTQGLEALRQAIMDVKIVDNGGGKAGGPKALNPLPRPQDNTDGAGVGDRREA